MKTKEMKAALAELHKDGVCYVTPELILEVATKHNVEAWELEGYHLDIAEWLETEGNEKAE